MSRADDPVELAHLGATEAELSDDRLAAQADAATGTDRGDGAVV